MIDDIFILQQIRRGDGTAFKFLFETYFSSLCRFSRLYVKNSGNAEEIVLDVFTHIWENKDTFQIKLTFKSYLFEAVKNRSYNFLRDNCKYIAIDDLSIIEKFEEDYNFESRELQRLIEEAICSLPSKNREVFEKSRKENLSNKEIAAEMNISIKTVEAQITKALKHIRLYLGDSYTYFW